MNDMTKDELIDILDSIINELGLFNEVRNKLESYGFSEDSYDNIIENLDL